MDELKRHQLEICELIGDTMALEVALRALLTAQPDRERLANAWKDAQDEGFIWTSDPSPLVGVERETWVKEAYLRTLARLRAVALFPDQARG